MATTRCCDVFREHYKRLCDVLHASSTVLASFTIALYTKEIIDLKTKSEVLRIKGFEGADTLLSHVMLKLQSNPKRFTIVLEVVLAEDALSDVGKKMESLHSRQSLTVSNRRIPNIEAPTTDAMSFAKHLKSVYEELVDVVYDAVRNVDVDKLRVRLNVFFMSDDHIDGSDPLLHKLDSCKTTEDVLLCLVRANFIGYLNYKLLEVFAKASYNEQALKSIDDYEKEYLKLFKCDFPSLIKLFRNPRLTAIPPVSLPEFTVRLGTANDQSDLYSFKEFFENRFSWAEHLLILDVIENCILIKYGVLPFFVSAVVRDLTDSAIIEELKKEDITIELSPQLKDIARHHDDQPILEVLPSLHDISSSDVSLFLRSHDLAITDTQKSQLQTMTSVTHYTDTKDESQVGTVVSEDSTSIAKAAELKDLPMKKLIFDEHGETNSCSGDESLTEKKIASEETLEQLLLEKEKNILEIEDEMYRIMIQLHELKDESQVGTVVSEDSQSIAKAAAELEDLPVEKLITDWDEHGAEKNSSSGFHEDLQSLDVHIKDDANLAEKVFIYEKALKQLLEERKSIGAKNEMHKRMMIELKELNTKQQEHDTEQKEMRLKIRILENDNKGLLKLLKDQLHSTVRQAPMMEIHRPRTRILARPSSRIDSYHPPPTIDSMSEVLKDLVDWKSLAQHVPDITSGMIRLIKERGSSSLDIEKLLFFNLWLSCHPNLSWNDVIDVLMKADEYKLAIKVDNHCPYKSENVGRPTDIKMLRELRFDDLVRLEQFANHLPKITQSDIERIKQDHPSSVNKSLFQHWLSVYPNSSWNDVKHALHKAGEHELAGNVMKMQSLQPLLLHHELKTLDNWEKFGLQLTGITSSDIEHIKSQYDDLPTRKLALYHKWISDCSDLADPSWEDVVIALRRTDENELAQDILTKWL